MKNKKFQDVLLFVASIALIGLGLFEPTRIFLYFFAIPVYFLLRRVTIFDATIYGVNFGVYLALAAHLYLTRYDNFTPFYAALVFHGLIWGVVFGLYAWIRTKYKHTVIQIFFAAWLYYMATFALHFISYTKAFVKIVNVPTIFDYMMPYVGVGIVDAIVLGLGFLIGDMLRRYYKKESFGPLGWYIALFTLLIVMGLVVMFKPKSQANVVRVAAVQGYFAYGWEERISQVDSIYEYYEATTKKAHGEGAQIVIWPEYALAVDILKERPDFAAKILELSRSLNVVIVMGIPEVAEESKRFNTRYKRDYDTTLVFDPQKGLLEPYRAIYPFSWNIFGGDKRVVFKTTYGDFLVLSCFEIARHKFIADQFAEDKRIEFIVVIGNNQIFTHTMGMERLKNHARHVPLEMGRDLLYVTNTGPTAHYTKDGTISNLLAYDTQDYFVTDVEKRAVRTVYSQYQEIPSVSATTLVIGFTIASSKKRRT